MKEAWANRFAVGDVVMLKSGGPPMTVKTVSQLDYLDDIEYACCWFNQSDQEFILQQGIFSGETLSGFIDE
ncbi:YodC family protein [Piscirickettsia litoralis]|uniref:DUF2158 domain-containing protein n=1 Tax=Piscirickettsia litoralis TaxID=1891921 RepID=A0ABX3A7Q6_9GAMM|nr:DUF2158 domain-containing protein [Piscirickettsia litoralis]ODN43450.1 hypothetical protein BGC07_11635 [Piscirickettsia litoralis]